METVTDFIWGAPKITADGDCSHEIKRHLLLGRKAMTNLDTILKSRDIILLTKVHLVKAMVFPVITHGCDSWTIKKAEHWRMDAFELWCWRRLLRVPWTERRSNQSTLKEIKTEYSLEGLMLNLKWRTDSFEKTLMLEEKGTARDEMIVWHYRLDGHEFEQVLGVGDGQGSLVCCSPWGHKKKDTSEWLNWTVLLGDTLMKRLWSSVKGGPIWKLTSLGVVSLANMGQVFQFMSSRYCWCTCSPSPYTLALGSWMESCRNWSANSRGPTLESNLDTGRKHGTGGQVVWRECSCLEWCAVLCCAQSLCRVHLLVTPRTVIHRAPLSMGFSRQEYWSGLPFPSLGDLPNPGTGPRDLLHWRLDWISCIGLFTTNTTWEALKDSMLPV